MFKSVEAKPNFIDLEHRILAFWEKNDILAKYLRRNDSSAKRFSFLDGPITANNPMAVHHAWGRTLKDLYQRFHNMLGEKQRFQNGFDNQGLWGLVAEALNLTRFPTMKSKHHRDYEMLCVQKNEFSLKG